jgi:hypothetical protein
MKLAERLRGPTSLLALAASYVMTRPRAAIPALRAALAVGIRVRRAPVLAPNSTLLVRPDELAAVCSLVSDTHLVAPRRSPCELDHEPEQWPWGPLPTSSDLTAGVRRTLEHIARHAPRTVVWCGDEVDSGEPEEWREWKKAVVQLSPGERIELFEGAAVEG